MSQHIYKTVHSGRPVQVLMGWDRPLQGFFLVIEYLDKALYENNYLYSNIDDMSLDCALPKALRPFLDRLATFGISVPQPMLQQVLADQAANAGNKLVNHN